MRIVLALQVLAIASIVLFSLTACSIKFKGEKLDLDAQTVEKVEPTEARRGDVYAQNFWVV